MTELMHLKFGGFITLTSCRSIVFTSIAFYKSALQQKENMKLHSKWRLS